MDSVGQQEKNLLRTIAVISEGKSSACDCVRIYAKWGEIGHLNQIIETFFVGWQEFQDKRIKKKQTRRHKLFRVKVQNDWILLNPAICTSGSIKLSRFIDWKWVQLSVKQMCPLNSIKRGEQFRVSEIIMLHIVKWIIVVTISTFFFSRDSTRDTNATFHIAMKTCG